MTRTRLPDYWALPKPGSTAPRTAINRTAPDRTRQMSIRLASRELVPLIYGRVQTAPLLFAAGVHAHKLVVGLLWCAGPLQDDPVLTTRSGEPLDASVDVAHVLGTADQAPHPWLQAALPGYDDSLVMATPGGPLPLAYTVLRYPSGASVDVLGEVIGPPLHDPLTGTDSWPADNPALWLLDFLSDARYGAGAAVDWDGSVEAVQACSEPLGDEPRRWGGLLINRAAQLPDHVDTLRTYAGAIVVRGKDGLRLVPKRPEIFRRPVRGEHWIGPLEIERIGRDQRPTVVTVEYTDTHATPWTTRTARAFAAGVEAGTAPWRESNVQLPGFQSFAVAKREAIERLNHATLSVLRFAGQTTDETLEDAVGDVIAITHPDGVVGQRARIIEISPESPGRWRLRAEQYGDQLYSDAIETDPLEVDTPFPDPTKPAPPVTGLTLTEEVYQQQTGNFSTRIRATWDASEWPFVQGYRIELLHGDALVWSSQTIATEAVTSAVQEGVLYTVQVRVLGALVVGEIAIGTLEALGKFLVPGDVPQMTVTRTDANAVYLSWQAALDVDIWGYELRYGTVWETAALINRVDSLSTTISGVPLGTHTWLVKAIDSVGQYSVNATPATITLSAPLPPASLDVIELGGETRMHWPASVSPFVQRYEVRYAPPETFDWAGADVLNQIDALRLTTREIPAGDWRIGVRAIDRAGNYSASEAAADVEVTLDDKAFLADRYHYSDPALTNMDSYLGAKDDIVYVTDSGETFGVRYPNALSTYANAMATYQTPTASEWLSEVHDLGVVVSGTWRSFLTHEAMAGTVAVAQLLSLDDATWDAEALSVNASARYVRLRAEAEAGSVLRVRVPFAETRVDVVTREETGTVASAASGPATVTLGRPYAFALSVQLTPVSSSPRQAVVDNIQTGDPTTFDVYMFNSDGDQVAGNVQWTFRGV